ncbi:hypothetical protein [Stenotrophomonas geniculata]
MIRHVVPYFDERATNPAGSAVTPTVGDVQTYRGPALFGRRLALRMEHADVRRAAIPLHVCEIVIRNAAAAALAHAFGPRWPWHPALLQRMPADGALSALQNIHRQAGRRMDTQEIIAILRFAFWQQLFTRRFEGAIWTRGLKIALPNAPQSALSVVRTNIHADLDRVRHLRNRIAHHEPILERDIGADLAAIGRLIHARCPHTLGWLQRHERATTVLAASPLAGRR